ncbi:unnamed protein product [Arabis nemorensis]|uniref:Peptidyl-prolyl cis-trans isomerase n=1 Tax=Arabis nemorensis TaxID=586526 RepID=A0A565AL46_9BRAS|nr:unnamed protein product [Arabis nemorensis]
MVSLRFSKIIFASDAVDLIGAVIRPPEWPSYRYQSSEVIRALREVDTWELLLEDVSSNQGARQIAKSVTVQERTQSYVAQGGPRWLNDLFEVEQKVERLKQIHDKFGKRTKTRLKKRKRRRDQVFHTVPKDFTAQTGDPTATGLGGDSIYKFLLYGEQARFFGDEIHLDLKHSKTGTVAMASGGENLNAFAEVKDDVRLEDDWVPMDEQLGAQELEEVIREKAAHSSAVVLESIGDIPEAEFVCKLNPVTEMDNALIDDRRIHVDLYPNFGHSSGRKTHRRVKGMDVSNVARRTMLPRTVWVNRQHGGGEGYDMVFEGDIAASPKREKRELSHDKEKIRRRSPHGYGEKILHGDDRDS